MENNIKTQISHMSFKDRYCAHFGCPPQEYAEHVLSQCCYWPASRLGKLLGLMDKQLFREDMALIQIMAPTRNSREFRRVISKFRYEHPSRGLLRRFLRIRFSGRKAMQLAEMAFGRNWGMENEKGEQGPTML